jgi:UDP-2,3-diacylglucosamine pyrophosphatase LpxH
MRGYPLSYLNQPKPQFFRSIFLSDFHIGAKSFNAAALLDFLRKTESETLYLVGDIIDGWKLHKRWYWNETASEIFDELFRKAQAGTKIIYITGNHDETVRHLSLVKRLRYARRLGIQIKNRIIHRCADGRDFLILHGDQFDRALLRGTVSRWSDRLYDIIADRLQAARPLNIPVDGELKRFSLSKFLTYHGQVALNILNNFERAVCREARRSDVEGIICGHTHIAALKHIGAITYANCGAWLKNGKSAIVENENGRLELLDWPYAPKHEGRFLPFYNGDIAPITILPEAAKFRPYTEKLIAAIRRTWPSPHMDLSRQDMMETLRVKLRLKNT